MIIVKKTIADKKFYNKLKAARDAAPTLEEIIGNRPGNSREAHKWLNSNHVDSVEITPNFKIKNVWECINLAMLKFTRSFTDYDSYGIDIVDDVNSSGRTLYGEAKTMKIRVAPPLEKKQDETLGDLF